MDPIHHLTQKLVQERLRNRSQQTHQPPPETAPPPYSEESENDSDSDSDDEEEPLSPVKLVINAAHSIQGSNNLVPTSATPLADASKFGTLLLHAVNQINGLNSNPTASKSRRPLKVDLTINCGLTVVGDRNVIGNVGLRPKSSSTTTAGGIAGPAAAVAGAKRKAEDDEDEQPPATKRIAASIHQET